MISFDLLISYSQIAVFNSKLNNPFNDWDEARVKQGFSWRKGSVSFKTLLNDEIVTVQFDRVDRFEATADSVRTISVPFDCDESGDIEIASITDSQPITVEPGKYQLVFETGMDGNNNLCRITMVKNGSIEPQVVVADSEISPRYPLIMESLPA